MNFARGRVRIGVLGAVTELPSVFNTDEENEQIEQGHSGVSEVKSIQQALKTRHYDPGTIDGFWGPNTCAAMLAFQKAKFGTAKNKYLDYDTFVALGFDVQQADYFTSKYATVCGGLTEPPSDYGPGTPAVVSENDVKKIQNALIIKGYSLKQDGVWGPNTCTALYDLQKKTTKTNSSLLLSSTFKALGFDGTTAMQYAQSFGQVCGPYWSPDVYKDLTPPDAVKPPKIEPDPGVVPPAAPAKAGVGVWLALGMAAAVGGAILFGKKGSKSRRRRR